MVVCKYFQQGTCRFGQYCRFEHNNYGGNQNERRNSYGEIKNYVLGVAEEILAWERGGQWLLSCFGPFKEQSCIPGMEDVSPEEVRWEMYQAQKNGTVDQTKLQFQQLCQAMNAKREELKSPSHETVKILEKLQQRNKDNAFVSKNNFTLSTPQLASSNPVFGSKTFGATNTPFGGGFPASTATSTSVFGRSTVNSSSVFGVKPSFGGNAIFGNQPAANSIFGGATTSTTSVFGGTQQNMPSFGLAAQAPTSFLTPATNSQSIFGQSATFGVATQQNNIFPSTQSTTSVFSGGTTASTSLFANSSTTQANTSPFGSTTQNPPTLFGGATTIQPSSSIFGNIAAAPVSSPSIFGQPKTTAAFGAAPIFGVAATFGGPTSTFVGPPAFSNSTNAFGPTTTTSTFGSNAQTTNSFSALAIPSQNTFINSQNSNSTFGNAVSTSPATTFSAATTTTATMAFGNTPFGTSLTAASPFSRANTFNTAAAGNSVPSTFGAVVSTPSMFGSIAAPTGFVGVPPSTPFASTTMTTTTSNPFGARSQQQQIAASFGGTPSGTTFGGMSAGPFGNSVYASPAATAIDSNIYSNDIDLTDDEKNIYMSDQFILGKIPLKPPTIELR